MELLKDSVELLRILIKWVQNMEKTLRWRKTCEHWIKIGMYPFFSNDE